MESVAVALILSINVDEHSEAFGNVAFGGQVDREGLRLVGDGDEGLDEAVAVDGTVLFELEASFGPFDLAGYLSKARHLEGSRGQGGGMGRRSCGGDRNLDEGKNQGRFIDLRMIKVRTRCLGACSE
jgi:hypothetical protein